MNWFFLALYLLYIFGVTAVLVLVAKAVSLFIERSAARRRDRILMSGRRFTATVLSKSYSGNAVAVRRVPRMKVECEIDGRLHQLEQAVPYDSYFHFNPGESIEIIVTKKFRFTPVYSLKGEGEEMLRPAGSTLLLPFLRWD